MNFLKEHKKGFIITTVVICLLLVIASLSEKYKPTFVNNALGFVLMPINAVITGAGSWVGEKVDFVVRMGEIESENRILKEQVESLSAENSRLKLMDKENERLSELLKIDRKYANYPMIGANVIAKDTGNWYNTFTIDKGTKDGIEKDNAVLSSDGLVGRVFEVGYNHARVRTLIDDISAVPSKSSRTDDIGYLRGDLYLMSEGKCRMEFIDNESEIMQGDEIVTAHISQIYPPGIIIGHVTEVTNNANGTKSAIVEPVVDFKHIETVLVINKSFMPELIDEVEE